MRDEPKERLRERLHLNGLRKAPVPLPRFLNPAPPLLRRPRNGTLEKSEKAQTYLFGWPLGSISAVSRVRSLILPEERLSGDECGLIFPNSG